MFSKVKQITMNAIAPNKRFASLPKISNLNYGEIWANYENLKEQMIAESMHLVINGKYS